MRGLLLLPLRLVFLHPPTTNVALSSTLRNLIKDLNGTIIGRSGRIMRIKRVLSAGALSLLIFSAAHAQAFETDSINNNFTNQSEQLDSLQMLSTQLESLKTELETQEKELQTEAIWKRRKHWDLGLCMPNITRTDGEKMTWDTEFALFLRQGKTTYFHSKPLGGMVKIGIDFGFIDVSYAKLNLRVDEIAKETPPTTGSTSGSNPNGGFDDIDSDDPSGSFTSLLGLDLGMHKLEYGLHIGPVISVNPWNHLIVSAYAHAKPVVSGIIENDKFSFGFGCAASTGLSVSYKAISVGVEGLWCTLKYIQPSFDEEDEEMESDAGLFNTKEFRLKQKDLNFYLSIRF